jgi:battenin
MINVPRILRACRNQVSTWSSGTGAAGVLGALSYAALTALHVSPSTTLLIMLIVPCALGITYVYQFVNM